MSRRADKPPFRATARCKYAVQMPIEGTIDGANGRSRHKGHCRAVVAATMGPSAVECRGVESRDWRWDGMFGRGRGSRFTLAGRRVAYWKPGSGVGQPGLVLGGCKVPRVMMVGCCQRSGGHSGLAGRV